MRKTKYKWATLNEDPPYWRLLHITEKDKGVMPVQPDQATEQPGPPTPGAALTAFICRQPGGDWQHGLWIPGTPRSWIAKPQLP